MLPILSSRIISAPRRIWQCLTILLLITPFLLSPLSVLNLYAAPNIQTLPNAITWPSIRLQSIADGFDNSINVVSPNDGTGRLFVLQRGGLIYIIENGVRLNNPFLNISDRVSTCSECGLLGIAFPPDFANNGYFFINYTSKADLVGPETDDGDTPDNGDTVIARFQVTENPNVANSADEEPILVINQPEANHNGGHILFGPDDYLYIGMGDGGGGDPFQNSQDPASLLGKLLRIEVGATGTYTIPADNPFVKTDGYRAEIWATGLRNPWRYNFDRATGDLYIADVGQGKLEEINTIAAADIGNGGMNFGWPIMEGDLCYPPNGEQDCSHNGLTLPVVTYNHDLGDCSVTGGFVYDSPLPNQGPVYLYGDFCSARVWGLQPNGNNWASFELGDFSFQITSFGDDANGNVYLLSYEGTLYQVLDTLQITQYIPTLSNYEEPAN